MRHPTGRVYLYGYRMNEVPIAPIDLKKGVKDDLKLKKVRDDNHLNKRAVLATNLPLCFAGASPPRPDDGHNLSNIAGLAKRFGGKTPPLNRATKRDYKRFLQLWLKRNLKPLTRDEIPTFEEWIESTPYSRSRKDELIQRWNDAGQKLTKREARIVNSFIKDETYPEWKYPRWINSRCDIAKCYFGPVVSAVSDRVFALDEFIKTVPVPDRPMVIKEKLQFDGSEFIFTDYTSFEAHFTQEVMEITQFALFRYMLKDVAEYSSWLSMYETTLGGCNYLRTKTLECMIMATRMSGEMDTSLSNGFANLTLFLFVCHMNGAREVIGFVEGDDGLFRVSPSECSPTAKQFADMGFTIKIGVTDKLSEASFCGQVYDMEDLIVVTDPVEMLCRVGWTNKRYVQAKQSTLMALLRARGYSLVYQYNGCPILSELGHRILELTAGVTIDERLLASFDQWEQHKLRAAVRDLPLPKKIGSNTRLLVERLYGVSTTVQLEMEQAITKMELGLVELPDSLPVPDQWKQYYDVYSNDKCDTDPCWLLRNEQSLANHLSKIPNFSKFVVSY